MGNRSREKFIASSGGLPIIPYGPGMPYANESAVIAALPVGSVVYDMAETVEANRMKRIKYVANLDGADTINFGFVLPENGKTGLWELEWLMAIDGMTSSVYTPFVSMVGENTTQHWRIQLADVANAISSVWRTSAGSVYSLARAYGFFDGKYHKHRVVVTSDLKGRYFVDGTQQDANADLNFWNPGTATSFRVLGSAASGAKTFTKICNMVASRNGVALANVPFSDGSGNVATDKSGNGYNGTITDASPTTFWDKACVPLSLGG